jgi:hypothetical protein
MVAKRIFLVLTVNGTSLTHFPDGENVLKNNLVSGISCYCSCLMSLNKSYFHNRNFVWLLFSSCSDSFGGLVVSMLASGTQGRRFKPGQSRWIFTDVKILSVPSSGGEVKESVPCPGFAACKRT